MSPSPSMLQQSIMSLITFSGDPVAGALRGRRSQDRVERFLARSTVRMMVLSKIGFSAIRQFYYLEST